MRRNREFNNRQASPGGPLMTNHLRDLDMELELLKRKREIIKQEQDMLSRFSTKRQYDNEPRSNTYNRPEPNNRQFNTNNFPHRFDGPSNSGNFTRPQGAKRHTPNQYWQSPPGPKRFTAQKINPWLTSNPHQEMGFPIRKNFPPQQENIGGAIGPLMSIRPSISQRIKKKNQIPRKDFKPTKVNKPKPQQAPNKLSTYPIAETKKLVSQVVTKDKKADSDQILRVDKTPTAQMEGRLELALGAIMKEIKTEHCTDPKETEYFRQQRLLKHIIRTRIRSVMIDQVVGNFSDIVTKYRKKFPKDTDLELVQIAKDAQTLSSKSVGVAQLIESDDPQQFYNRNMVRALFIKFDEIFDNLEKFYQNKEKNLDEYIKHTPEYIDKDKAQNQSKENTNSDSGKEKVKLENLIGEGDNVQVINEKLSKVKFYTEFMDELIEQKLPKVLPKFKDAILSMILTDKEFLVTKSIVMSQLNRKINRSFDKDIDIEFIKSSTTDIAPKTMTETSAGSSAEKLTDTATPSGISSDAVTPSGISSDAVTPSGISSDAVTPSGISSDAVTPSQASPVRSSTNATPKTIENSTPATPNNMSNKQNIQKSDDLLYVKLISRPNLPARAVIYEFLEKFKPASIKKHKSIKNLLVIGFVNKEDYDKIIAVNETVVGNATIIIKASEPVIKIKQPVPEEGKDESVKSDNNSLLDDSLIGSDLDSQITDLLTSIGSGNESDGSSDAINSTGKINASGTTDETEADTKSTTDKINIDGSEKCIDAIKAEEELDTANTDGKTTIDIIKTEPTTENVELEETTSKSTIESVVAKSGEEKNVQELETIMETSDGQQNNADKNNSLEKPDCDKLKDNLKESGRATPTRSSSRLASSTPSTIRTRRASRLAQNN